MATEIRQQRVGELLFQELSVMLGGEMADPQISLVDVLAVRVSKDLRNAKVYVYHEDESVEVKDLIRALRRATPYLRGQLAVRCGLRLVPELVFYYDRAPGEAPRVDAILRQIAEERSESDGASATAAQ